MESRFAKTTELTDKEFAGILNLFNSIFSRSLTSDELKSQYTSTEFGFSYHSYLIENDEVIAHHAAFPSEYYINGRQALTYYTGSTMVDRRYRDGFCFLNVVKNLSLNMKQLGFGFAFGFPNELSYKVFGKLKMCKDIGRLNIYCLPYRIGGIKKSLSLLNPFSKLFCLTWAWLNHFGGSKSVINKMIHKNDDVYNITRYNRLEQEYNHIIIDGVEFYYCIKLHENVRTAFLIDVRQKSQYNFKKAIWYIIKHSRNDFDLLMYIGDLDNIGSIGLIHIPGRFEPKHFYVTGELLDKSLADESQFYNVNNWDLNLSNYDVI